jgi:hypothetical protein
MSAVGELVQGERGGRWLAGAVACAAVLALWGAAPARAVDYTIPGSPLTVYANDAGQLQVAFTGSATGEFFPGSLSPASAGVNVAESTSPPNLTVYGFRGSLPLVQDSNRPSPGLTGNGSAGSPYTLTINLSDDGFLHVQEVLTYVNGTTDVGVRFTLQAFDNAVTGRLYAAADLYVAGNDQGVGSLDPGPPRQVGGVNEAAGSSARLVEGTPAWDHFQESFYDSVYSVITDSTSTTAPNLNDAINPTLGDNDVGVQWNFASLSANLPGQTYSATWRFKHFSALDLTATPAQVTGKTATVTVTARNADGGPDSGRTVRYAIAGANPGSGAVSTGADGTAAISWTGNNAGTDTFSAYTDINGNGVRDANEPERTATVTWTAPPPPPPPVPGKSVVVRVVSGEVFVKLPGSGRARATGPPKGFVPFTGAANIPVGSQLDTNKGRVALTSAADTGGAKTQSSDFYDGIFQVKQSVPKKKPKKPKALITDLVMKGQIARSQCAPLKGARSAAVDATKKKKGPKSVLGKLWGNGKGKFRTSGKYSSATVRGTIWLVEDRCDGTLTKVSRGTVQVRDLKRKKTVTVKAGHSYLARAQRAASKTKRR